MSGYVYPVAGGGRITSGIGQRRAPTAGASTNHAGIDISGRTGTPILATSNQRVTFAGRKGGYGNVVYAVDDNGFQHRYAHLNTIDARAGEQVQAGTQLGGLGSTGRSTGPHLHYEVRDQNGRVLNPNDFLSGAISKGTGIVERGLTAGKDAALTALDKALEAVPFVGEIWAGSKAAGIPNIFDAAKGECGLNPICHLRNWLDDTAFMKRLALAFFAFILLVAAFYLFKGASMVTIQNKAKGMVS